MILGKRKNADKGKLERERRKNKNRKYGQAELKHSKKGVTSCLIAGTTLFFLLLLFSVSYLNRGNVDMLIGAAGLLVVVLAVIGTSKGVQGFKERDKNYTSCKVGVALNGLFLITLIAIFLRGLF